MRSGRKKGREEGALLPGPEGEGVGGGTVERKE